MSEKPCFRMAKQERQTGWQERNRSGTGCEEKKPVPCFGFKLHLIVGATCEPPCFLPCNQSLCSRKRMDPAYGMKPVIKIRQRWKSVSCDGYQTSAKASDTVLIRKTSPLSIAAAANGSANRLTGAAKSKSCKSSTRPAPCHDGLFALRADSLRFLCH